MQQITKCFTVLKVVLCQLSVLLVIMFQLISKHVLLALLVIIAGQLLITPTMESLISAIILLAIYVDQVLIHHVH